MTEDQREIRTKKRVLEYAEKNGNIRTACRRFGIARSHRTDKDEFYQLLTYRTMSILRRSLPCGSVSTITIGHTGPIGARRRTKLYERSYASEERPA